MYRVRLTEEQKQELQRQTRAPGLKPRTRDRLEMVRLADAGLSIPQIARIADRNEDCVRHWIKRFLEGGFAALPDPPHPGQSSSLTPDLLAALRTEIDQRDRTWTAGQLADWLAVRHGLRLTAEHLGTLLRRAGFSYRRTERCLKHKQDPEQVEARRKELEGLEKGGMPGAWTGST